MGESETAPERLRVRLRELGWTQLEFSEVIGASPANVSRWLSGERTPSLDMAFRIQRSAVGLPADAWVTHAAEESGDYPALADDVEPPSRSTA